MKPKSKTQEDELSLKVNISADLPLGRGCVGEVNRRRAGLVAQESAVQPFGKPREPRKSPVLRRLIGRRIRDLPQRYSHFKVEWFAFSISRELFVRLGR